MDNILEIIGPLIVGAIYILGNLFSRMKKASEGEDDSPEQRQISQQEHQQELEEAEHWRRIRAKQRAQTAQTETQVVSPPASNLNSQSQRTESMDGGDFSWDKSDDSYDRKLELQLKKIEATKREAARLQSAPTRLGGEIGSLSKRSKKNSSRSVRSSLRHPAAARSAFIYGEVLGQPVSLRKSSGVPGLNS